MTAETAAASVPSWHAFVRLVLLLAIIVVCALPLQFSMPEPQNAHEIDGAEYIPSGAPPERVTLPHSWGQSAGPGPLTVSYRVAFDRADLEAGHAAFLLVPALRHHVEVQVNGQPPVPVPGASWGNSARGYSYLARIPDSMIRNGDNVIDIRFDRWDGLLKGYLSPVYLGTGEALLPYHRLLNFIIDQSNVMTFALHIVIMIGIAFVWFTRQHDTAFRWLVGLSATSFFLVLAEVRMLAFGAELQGMMSPLMSAVGIMVIGLACTVSGYKTSRWLVTATIVTPLVLYVLLFAGHFTLVNVSSGAIAIATYLVAASILVAAFARHRNWEAAVLAIPFILTGWYGLHDIAVAVGLTDSAFMLVTYMRLPMLLAVMIVLMRRLAVSLNHLDRANEILIDRLAEQEAELKVLHEQERQRTGQLVREHERQRLTRDLHDGLSGHLVSIIALAERDHADPAAIEASAREALSDLRLVINSLDIGDHDLPVALAGFRERLEPQLRRMDVALDWSMEHLPDIGGVTPGNALAVLRILQEAVTNALKHGPATRISIWGSAPDPANAVIMVENDGGLVLPVGRGHGLINMRRRAEILGGSAILEADGNGSARLVLRLPVHLPDIPV